MVRVIDAVPELMEFVSLNVPFMFAEIRPETLDFLCRRGLGFRGGSGPAVTEASGLSTPASCSIASAIRGSFSGMIFSGMRIVTSVPIVSVFSSRDLMTERLDEVLITSHRPSETCLFSMVRVSPGATPLDLPMLT